MQETDLAQALDMLADLCFINSSKHGFWSDHAKNDPLIKLALITSEIGEAVEAVRKPTQSDHCPEVTALEEELADILIRVFDLAGGLNLNIGKAVRDKMAYNSSRPYKHGKQY